MITPGFDEVGGAARRSLLLARGLAGRGWHVRAITRSGTRRLPRLVREPRLLALELPGYGLGRLGAVPFFLLGLPIALLWARRARVVFAVQLMSTATVAGLAAAVARRPWVAGSTTSGELGETRYIVGRRTVRWRRRLLASVSTLIAQTPQAAEELASLVPERHIRVVPNPVVMPAPAPPLLGSRSALYTGRFSDEKELPGVLVAWRQVALADPEARLVLAGAGGAYRSVEESLRLSVASDPVLQASVSFPGWVEDVPQLLRQHDVYVFASRSEGMSNSLLEACAHARVVVVSAIPSNLSVVGADYPLLFPPGDTEALADCLEVALHDGVLRDRARTHLAARMPSMSVDAVLDQVEEVLRGATRRARHQLA